MLQRKNTLIPYCGHFFTYFCFVGLLDYAIDLYIKVVQNGQITPAGVHTGGTHLTCPPHMNTAGVICTFLKVYIDS